MRATGDMVTPSVWLVRPLRSGGMGSVWIAEHRSLETQVVVKFMSEALAADGPSRERFSREASAAAQVKSPHVVQTFDHGVTADGVPYIVMELLEGEDLGERLERQATLRPKELSSIVTQVSRALVRAHERGIVHRDIKPENIFLCELGGDEPFVKLLDFGIAKKEARLLQTETQTGGMMGTPFYMSPEQLVGQKTDFRADIWSLGVVAYECLVGTRPFEADTIGGLALVIHNGEMPRPSQRMRDLDPAVGTALDEWFARACARSPDARFSSAREMADALAEAVREDFVQEGLPVVSRRSRAEAPTHTPVLLAAGEAPAVAPEARVTEPSHDRRQPNPWMMPSVAVAALIVGVIGAVAIRGLLQPSSVTPAGRGESSSANPSASTPAPAASSVEMLGEPDAVIDLSPSSVPIPSAAVKGSGHSPASKVLGTPSKPEPTAAKKPKPKYDDIE